MQPTHRHGFRSVYTLTVYIVFVTKYRRQAINQTMLTRLREIFRETCAKWECQLLEFNGESDHVHLLVNFSPQVQLSKLIANLKTVSSRLLRKEFDSVLERIYSKPVFWSGSYFVASCGDVTIETLRKYVEVPTLPEVTSGRKAAPHSAHQANAKGFASLTPLA